jgi:hypothetical protein
LDKHTRQKEFIREREERKQMASSQKTGEWKNKEKNTKTFFYFFSSSFSFPFTRSTHRTNPSLHTAQ